LLQIATVAVAAIRTAAAVAISNFTVHTKVTERTTIAYKLKWVVVVRTMAIIITAFAGVLQVPSNERFAARRCSLAYSIKQY
jgi:hypothetical protein